jgi:hypothetical protein
MTKRKTRYHTFTTSQGNAAKKVTAPQGLRRQIEEILTDMESNRHGVSLRLISLADDSFVYEESQEGATRKYRVNLVSWESGQKVPDFSSQELIDDQTNNNSVMTNAVQNYFNEMKGDKNMNKIEPLVIPGQVIRHSDDNKAPLIPPIIERKSWEYPGADRRKDDKQKNQNTKKWDDSKGVEPLIPIVS